MKHTMAATDILLALAAVAIWGVNLVVIKIGAGAGRAIALPAGISNIS